MGPSNPEKSELVYSQSFHSTDCPSEWGRHLRLHGSPRAHVSIQLIAPASGATSGLKLLVATYSGFHSTDCPSEWGHKIVWKRVRETPVSIQLIAPASGATPKVVKKKQKEVVVSIQLIAPASGANS